MGLNISTTKRLAMKDALPFDATAHRFEYLSCDLGADETIITSEGVTGTRTRRATKARQVSDLPRGAISMQPSKTELDRILAWLLQGTTVGGVTTPGETSVEKFILVDKGLDVFLYSGCVASRVTFSGQQGQPLTLTVEVEAETETAGQAFPSLTLPADNFFVFSDVTITLNAVARVPKGFSLVIDNVPIVDRQHNSTTRSEIPASDRVVTLTVDGSYISENSSLYGIGSAGFDGSMSWNDGTNTYLWDFGKLILPKKQITLPGRRTEVPLPIPINVFGSDDGTQPDVKVTKT